MILRSIDRLSLIAQHLPARKETKNKDFLPTLDDYNKNLDSPSLLERFIEQGEETIAEIILATIKFSSVSLFENFLLLQEYFFYVFFEKKSQFLPKQISLKVAVVPVQFLVVAK